MPSVIESVRFHGYDVAVLDSNGVIWTLVDASTGQYRKIDSGT